MNFWPFQKKERTLADVEKIHGRPLRAAADRDSLIEKLKTNRSNQNTGSGQKYWESVVDVVERHYGLK